MRFPPFFHADKRGASMDSKQKRSKPKLDRRNAVKNIDYDASSWYSSFALRTRSLEEVRTQTSFRVDGADGEIDRICHTLGLSGPDDLAIPVAAWEARKARSSSDLLPRSRLNLPPDSPAGDEKNQGRHDEGGYLDLCTEFGTRVNIGDVTPASAPCVNEEDSNRGFARARDCSFSVIDGLSNSNASGGIKGVRPPALAPPPAMALPVLDKMCSTWDIMRSLAPAAVDRFVPSKVCEEEDEEFGTWDDYGRMAGLGDTADMTGSCSFSTSNDDDSSSTTTEGMFVSPNGRIKRNIRSWIRGTLLGSGSFGTVYEGISDDGFFFAIKEVSLLDQGSKAQQCILQLEQEIALLSQFEHENIVQYLGTDKEEAKLYIFLELVTQGSLASLYQRYNLQDSQVSAYTRQILNGLSYLHDRNVLHRDIKCANILVDASGSVKLADFGLAKETSKINKLKSCKGSAYWMAPEVVNPRKTYGLPADIWSLGCTVLEMLTRQLPYFNLEWTQALFKIGKGEPPSIPKTLSKDAQDFIHQCLRVEPDNRPSASELLEHPFLRRPLPAFSGSGSPYNKRRL